MIVGPLIIVAAFAAVARFVLAERMSERLYDHTLLTVALTISRDVVLSEGDVLAEELLESLTQALGDPVFYRVSAQDGGFVTGYSDFPAPPREMKIEPGKPNFYDATYFEKPVRVVALREFISDPQIGGWVTVQVWQTVSQREALSLELVAQAVLLMAVVIIAAGAAVWFGINFGLRPLLDLREAVMLRSPDDLGPIRRPIPREVRSLVQAMNGLFGRLSTAFAERDAFISDAAHQLRNPIAGIRALAESAETAPTEEELRRRTGEVADAARHASRLTQQLLSMEKARGRSALAGSAKADLVAIAEGVARAAAPGALRRGIEISLAVDGEPFPVRGDAVMLTEAVENLVDNSFRYGCKDGGAVRVRLKFETDRVQLIVEDDGPGIPASEREAVFRRFHRICDDGSDGCGLGLSIVREVAERHGGRASIAECETGARFIIDFPR